MLDIGWQELFIVAVVAIVVIGPKELPRAVKAMAQILRKGRSMAREFQDGFDDILREAELDDLKKELSGASRSSLTERLVPQPCLFLGASRSGPYFLPFISSIISSWRGSSRMPSRSLSVVMCVVFLYPCPYRNPHPRPQTRLSVKSECLNRMILFGERSLRRALHEYGAHFHRERPHQGLGNELISPEQNAVSHEDAVVETERLGGLLRSYHRAA